MKISSRSLVSSVVLGISILLLIVLFRYFNESKSSQKSGLHFAILPHFMLASEKVDAFYAFLKAKRYADTDPMTIILLSPNHFHPSSTTPQTLCTSSEIYFRQQKYFLTPYPEIACDKQIFFPFGNAITTKEHGIGEHLPRIKRYFPMTKTIIPLVLPTHQRPMLPQEVVLPDHTLVIASVDFSHYLPEAVAQANDTVSISTLQSGTGEWIDFRGLDVDCPACLYVVHQLAGTHQQQANVYWRDSSSTILGRDMQEENTSRVFVWYE